MHALLILVIATSISDAEAEFTRLAAQRPQIAGRAEIVRGFERLINNHVGEEIAARSMLKIGTLFLLQDRSCNMVSDPQEAQVWFRRAAEAAEPGSKTWIDATSRVARDRRDASPRQPENLAESRQLFESIRPFVTDGSPPSIRLEYELFQQSLREEKLKDAHQVAAKIKQQISKLNPGQIDAGEKVQLELLNELMAKALIGELQRSSAADREQEIRLIRDEYQEIESVRAMAEKVISTFPKPRSIRKSKPLLGLAIINTIAVITVAVVFVRRRQRARL